MAINKKSNDVELCNWILREVKRYRQFLVIFNVHAADATTILELLQKKTQSKVIKSKPVCGSKPNIALNILTICKLILNEIQRQLNKLLRLYNFVKQYACVRSRTLATEKGILNALFHFLNKMQNFMFSLFDCKYLTILAKVRRITCHVPILQKFPTELWWGYEHTFVIWKLQNLIKTQNLFDNLTYISLHRHLINELSDKVIISLSRLVQHCLYSQI